MRLFCIVLDSVGIGASADSHLFGDRGCDTLGHIAENVKNFSLPNLEKLGLGLIKPGIGLSSLKNSKTEIAILEELSASKDTSAGHWEMMGVPVTKPFPRFDKGFPPEITEKFSKLTGHHWIGNYPESGTTILETLGEEHLKTGKLILYTSADSVFQIAAHLDKVPIEELYRICKITRELVDPYNILRVIARPFEGVTGDFRRVNSLRRDFSMNPTGRSHLEVMQREGIKTIAVGKTGDIFNGVGIDQSIHTNSNNDGMEKTISLIKDAPDRSFIFTNLVEFDSVYGHRRNPEGYYEALKEFDSTLPRLIDDMKDEDYLFITADHGCDPTFKGTDHTREDVPLIIYSSSIKEFQNLGRIKGFDFIGKTALKLLGVN
jgi:phosphopentomutase